MPVKCDIRLMIVILSTTQWFSVNGYAGEITDSEHRTKAATEKLPTLVCYRCNTMTDERCLDLHDNSTNFHANCSDDARICQVKRISLTTISKTGDMTGKPKLWLLQRNCTGTCDPGCIIIGERTKLYSCTTCCEESFCNHGNGASTFHSVKHFARVVLCLYVTILTLSKNSGDTL